MLAVNYYDEFLKIVEIIAESYSAKRSEASPKDSDIIVFVGPSGSGKSKLATRVLAENDTYETEFTWINDASVLEFGAELYIMYGATFNLSIDLDILSEGVVMIFE